jgi:CelD/BcsL family acetyltransferase involved in cellulose biosynthesis
VSLKVREHDGDLRLLRPIWNDIVARQSAGILRLDITSTLEWAETLGKALLIGKSQKILLLEHGGEIVGLLPLYESSETRYRLRFKKVAPTTELYSGRSGFILKDYRIDYLEAFIDYLYNQLENWSVFQLTLVDDSESDSLLREVCKLRGLHCGKMSIQASPYIVLENSWQVYLNSLPKKFRWNLRNGKKKLEACGPLRYSVCEKASQMEAFLSAVFEIERASWKETARTSITANDYQEVFYKEFCALALDRGWFYGHLLELDGEPIAYIYGATYQGAFYDFKESYKAKYKELSPGHVLKTFVFEELYRRNVRLYDFMGACDDYKLRWTAKTYSRSTYVMYNNNPRGLALRVGQKLARYMGSRKASSPQAINHDN